MKKFRIFLYIIIIINILISLLLIVNKQKVNKNISINDNAVSTKSIELNGKIMPENHYAFENKINDKEGAKELYSDIYYLVKNLYKLYESSEKLGSNTLEKNYEDNKEAFIKLYNLNTSKDYINLIQQCKKIYSDGIVYYDTIKILMEEYKEISGHYICEFEVVLKNNKSFKIKFDMSKDKTDTLVIKFEPVNEVE